MAAVKKTSSTKKKLSSHRTKNSQSGRNGIFIYAAIGVLAALLIVTAGVFTNQSSGQIRGVRSYPNLDRSHTTLTVAYDPLPPVGGAHDEVLQNCGVYDVPVRNENAVHSLEHGVIWITYQPDLPENQVQILQTLTRQSAFRLLSPFPGLTSPIVVSAWGYQLKLKKASDARLADFIQKYEQSPFGPEPGATCTGGIGSPSQG